MSRDPKFISPAAGRAEDSIEDLVYRSSLSEGDRAVPGTSPWLTIPVTLAVAATVATSIWVLARRTETGVKVFQSVAVVLQEGPPGPGRVPAAAPRPAPAPGPHAPAPVAAPAPAVQPRQPPPPPPDPRQEAAPEQAPRALPQQDLSRLYGSNTAPAAGGTGSGQGAAAGSGGSGAGTGGGGGAPGRIMDLAFTEVSFKYRPAKPPPYPAMAKSARIQGLVVVQVLVGVDGVPISATALEGPAQLRAAAMADAMTWRINPPTLNGFPQVSRIKITYNFQLGQ